MQSARLPDCSGRRGCSTASRPARVRPAVAAQVGKQQAAAQPETASRRALLLAGSVGLLGLGWQVQPSYADNALQATVQSLEGLRQKEGEAVRALQQEADRTKDGKLCGTPFGVDVVGITQLVALIGALVGGVVARQRKEEVERLNEQLRKINLQLKRKIKSTAVPGHLAHGRSMQSMAAEPAEASTAGRVTATLLSMEEDDMSPDMIVCRDALRTGKQLLKDKNGSAAMVRFEKALMLSKALGDKVQERRANRGLAAAARLQGQYRTAITHYQKVLDISKELNEFSGYVDVYGAIADCYTDLGELDNAATNYDKYLAAMNAEMLVAA